MVQLMWERAGTRLAADEAGRNPSPWPTNCGWLAGPRCDARPACCWPENCGPAAFPPPAARCWPPRPRSRAEPGQPARMVVSAELGDGIALAVAATEPWQSQARRVVADWLAVAGERTILLPSPRSFCAGVERAIKTVDQALAQNDGQVYVRRQIVHNKSVVADLESRGAVFVSELDQVPSGATVVFSAHGVSPAVRREASDRKLSVIDATCPLVRKVHAEARRFADLGSTVVLIGHPWQRRDRRHRRGGA